MPRPVVSEHATFLQQPLWLSSPGNRGAPMKFQLTRRGGVIQRRNNKFYCFRKNRRTRYYEILLILNLKNRTDRSIRIHLPVSSRFELDFPLQILGILCRYIGSERHYSRLKAILYYRPPSKSFHKVCTERGVGQELFFFPRWVGEMISDVVAMFTQKLGLRIARFPRSFTEPLSDIYIVLVTGKFLPPSWMDR